MTLEFLLTSIVVILLPGTGVFYTLTYGLARGWVASVIAALGCTLGILPHIAASVLGIAALLHTSALAFQIFKFLGVAYLLYMAFGILKEKGALDLSSGETPQSGVSIMINGFLLNILNPKLSLFFLAFLPQFVPVSIGNGALYSIGLGAVFMLMTFIVFVGYGAFASATRQYVISKPRVMLWLRRGFAGAFAGLGVKLALSDR